MKQQKLYKNLELLKNYDYRAFYSSLTCMTSFHGIRGAFLLQLRVTALKKSLLRRILRRRKSLGWLSSRDEVQAEAGRDA